jgi:ribosomal protein S18 acetylase RimI-like enzyme
VSIHVTLCPYVQLADQLGHDPTGHALLAALCRWYGRPVTSRQVAAAADEELLDIRTIGVGRLAVLRERLGWAYQLRRATADDLTSVLDLLRAGAQEMHANGYDAWRREGFPQERIAPTVAEGSVWLLTHAGNPIATITLDTHLDPEFVAGGHDPHGAALLMHRMARHPATKGRALGSLLLRFANNYAARHGFAELWLNVNRAGIPLQNWYLRHGFTHFDTVTSTGRKSGWLARKAVTDPVALPDVDVIGGL